MSAAAAVVADSVPAVMFPTAASAYEIVLAVHVMAIVVAFGLTFAYPIMFAVGARSDPRSLPTLHRIDKTGLSEVLEGVMDEGHTRRRSTAPPRSGHGELCGEGRGLFRFEG